jgi:hypothetical protein
MTASLRLRAGGEYSKLFSFIGCSLKLKVGLSVGMGVVDNVGVVEDEMTSSFWCPFERNKEEGGR